MFEYGDEIAMGDDGDDDVFDAALDRLEQSDKKKTGSVRRRYERLQEARLLKAMLNDHFSDE
jgi:hypothetical protein